MFELGVLVALMALTALLCSLERRVKKLEDK